MSATTIIFAKPAGSSHPLDFPRPIKATPLEAADARATIDSLVGRVGRVLARRPSVSLAVGTLWICALSCREMMPDPAFFADCLRESFEDLKRGAAVHAERAAPPAVTAAAPAARAAPAPKTRKRPRAAAATTRRRKVNGTATRHLS